MCQVQRLRFSQIAAIAYKIADIWHVRYRWLTSPAFAKCARSRKFLRSLSGKSSNQPAPVPVFRPCNCCIWFSSLPFFLALTFARAFNTLLLPHRLSDISLSFVLFNLKRPWTMAKFLFQNEVSLCYVFKVFLKRSSKQAWLLEIKINLFKCCSQSQRGDLSWFCNCTFYFSFRFARFPFTF